MDSRWWLFLGVVAALAVLAYLRVRSLKPSWAWNDVAINLVVGGRLYEVFVAELRGVGAADGQLVFETERGQIPIAGRWVVQPFIHALAVACDLADSDVQRALATPSPTWLWRGETGAFRLPTVS